MKELETMRCANAVSLFRGLYARVAREMGVDASYISRIARGERKSILAEKALIREFNRAVATVRIGSEKSAKNYIVAGLVCPRCKTQQKVHIAARAGFGQISGERASCVNCDNRFKVTIPARIIRGPFPA